MAHSNDGRRTLLIIVCTLYILLLLSSAEMGIVVCLYATRTVDTTISASLILTATSVSAALLKPGNATDIAA